jgi:hypothetical protein
VVVDPELLEDGGVYETEAGTRLELTINSDGTLVWTVVEDGDGARRSLLATSSAGVEQTVVLNDGELQVSCAMQPLAYTVQGSAVGPSIDHTHDLLAGDRPRGNHTMLSFS